MRKRGNPSSPSQEPVAIGEILRNALRDARPAAGPEPIERIREIQAMWEKIAGAELARQARVAAFRGGVLQVMVSSAPLCAELRTFARAGLLTALQTAGLTGLHDIQFRVGA